VRETRSIAHGTPRGKRATGDTQKQFTTEAQRSRRNLGALARPDSISASPW